MVRTLIGLSNVSKTHCPFNTNKQTNNHTNGPNVPEVDCITQANQGPSSPKHKTHTQCSTTTLWSDPYCFEYDIHGPPSNILSGQWMLIVVPSPKWQCVPFISIILLLSTISSYPLFRTAKFTRHVFLPFLFQSLWLLILIFPRMIFNNHIYTHFSSISINQMLDRIFSIITFTTHLLTHCKRDSQWCSCAMPLSFWISF